MINRLFLLLFCVGISGCDRWNGPSIRNEFPNDIQVTISYEDGKIFSGIWPPCRTTLIGATEIGRFGVKQKNIMINSIVVESKEKIIHSFDMVFIDNLVQKEKESRKYLAWVLDHEGIHLSKNGKCNN